MSTQPVSTAPTDEGKRFIDRWIGAQEELRHCQSRLNSADCEVSNSKNALGKWLMPTDAKKGETFCVWYGDSLIAATYLGDNDFKVEIRSRGKRGLG